MTEERTYVVSAHATATARIEVTATSEEEAIEKAKAIGGFEIENVDELLDFEVEDYVERV